LLHPLRYGYKPCQTMDWHNNAGRFVPDCHGEKDRLAENYQGQV